MLNPNRDANVSRDHTYELIKAKKEIKIYIQGKFHPFLRNLAGDIVDQPYFTTTFFKNPGRD